MVNLWGPGAFGAARPAAVRPSFTPADGAGDLDDWAQDCTSPTARDGTEWRSALLNELIAQLRGVARNSSVAPSNLNPVLLAQAIASGHFTWAAATGTANAWVVAPALAVPAYAAGRVLWVKAPATNTDPTVTANVSGLGARPVKKRDGSDPAGGDLVAGTFYPTIDDGTNIRVVSPLASDVNLQVAVNKSPFNLAQATSSTRTTYTGVTGYQTVLSGTYTKKSATSVVDIRTVLNVLSNAAIAAGLFRIVFGGVQGDKHIAVNMTSTSNQTSPHGDDTFAGIAAGAAAWSLQIGRDDANAWTSVWNPDSTNTSNLPAFTTTVVKFQEREP